MTNRFVNAKKYKKKLYKRLKRFTFFQSYDTEDIDKSGKNKTTRIIDNILGTAANNLLHNSTQTIPVKQRFKMLWLTTHAPGVLKSPVFVEQTFSGVKKYNAFISNLLEPLEIPIFDSFNLSVPIHSVEGTHYGYGANMMKTQILLNWVKERQDRLDW